MQTITSLKDKLAAFREDFTGKVPPEQLQVMLGETEKLSQSGIAAKAPKIGDILPAFELSNQVGEIRKLPELLQQGPVVLTFYRGGWCPYCNLELRSYQDVLDEIKAAGATLVALTPELPDSSLTTIEKNQLGFEVLSDINSDYARSLGLVFTLPDSLRPIYEGFGIHLEEYNGDGQFDLPLAATFIIRPDGTIASAFVDADYTVRKDPLEIVQELQNL